MLSCAASRMPSSQQTNERAPRTRDTEVTWPLDHFDGDVFWFLPVGENAFGPSGVIFTIEPNRVASAVRIEYLDGFGQGTLTRV